jgi:AcrR family transcriptional regulator
MTAKKSTLQKQTAAGNGRIHKGERLKEIVKAAVKLFYENGYAQTTTRQIARACGISQGNLYYYIKSKEDFFDLFVQMTTEEFNKYDREILSHIPDISYSEALKQKIREGMLLQDTIQDLILFWYHESRNIGRRHLNKIQKQEHQITEVFKKIIDLGCKAGEFSVADPSLAASFIVMMEHMWSLKRWHLRRKYTLDEYIQKCQEAALGLVNASTPAKSANPKAKKRPA